MFVSTELVEVLGFVFKETDQVKLKLWKSPFLFLRTSYRYIDIDIIKYIIIYIIKILCTTSLKFYKSAAHQKQLNAC